MKGEVLEVFKLEDDIPKEDTIEVDKTSKPATKEENAELINRLRNGEAQAFDLLIKRNMRLVNQIAWRYAKGAKSFTVEDLTQEGIIGLMSAISGYDEEQGAFSTYATDWIESSIRRALEDRDSLIREPVHFKEKKRKLKTYSQEHDNIDNEQIKKDLGFTDETLRSIQDNIAETTTSLNQIVGEGEDTELGDLIKSPEDGFKNINEVDKAKEFLVFIRQKLRPSYYFIFYYRMPPNKIPLYKIGSAFATTHEFIRQRQNYILKTIEPFLDSSRRHLSIESPLDKEEYANFDKLRVTPIDPREITTYLFIRDHLTEFERLVYKELHFSKWEADLEFLAKRLNKHPGHLEVHVNKINEIIEKYTRGENTISYNTFHNNIINEYNSQVYKKDLDNLNIEPFKDYRFETITKWMNVTYAEFLEIIENNGISIAKDLLLKFKLFFRQPSKRTSGLDKKDMIENPINELIFGLNRRCEVGEEEVIRTLDANTDKFTSDERYCLLFYFGIITKQEYLRNVSKPFSANSLTTLLPAKFYKVYLNYKGYYYLGFSKEQYLEIRDECQESLPEDLFNILESIYHEGKSLAQCAKELNMTPDKFDARYKRARERAMSIYMKRNSHFVSHSINFEEDITPYIGIFPKKDQDILTDLYLHKLTHREVTKKYNITESQLKILIKRYRLLLFETKNEKTNRLSFDYFWSVVYDDDLPFFGNKEMAIKIFKLHQEDGMPYSEIVKNYYPKLTINTLKRILYSLELAVQKRKIGITNPKPFPASDILDYYIRNHESMPSKLEGEYQRYFEKYDGYTLDCRSIPRGMALSLVKDREEYFNLSTATREDIIEIIKKYYRDLTAVKITFLVDSYGIKPEELISNDDLDEMLDFLSSIDEFLPNPKNPKSKNFTIKPIN